MGGFTVKGDGVCGGLQYRVIVCEWFCKRWLYVCRVLL